MCIYCNKVFKERDFIKEIPVVKLPKMKFNALKITTVILIFLAVSLVMALVDSIIDPPKPDLLETMEISEPAQVYLIPLNPSVPSKRY
jgi:ABC-type uncharacterized transport system permease subunit